MKLLSTVLVSLGVCLGVLWLRDLWFVCQIRTAWAAGVRADWIESRARAQWLTDHRNMREWTLDPPQLGGRYHFDRPTPEAVREDYQHDLPAYRQAAAVEYDRR